jgi:hypothetical protein
MSIYQNYTDSINKPIKINTENINNINHLIILSALINMGTLGISVATFFYINKLSQMGDYFNDIADNTILNNETLVSEYINRLPHIIDTLCDLISC